MFIAKRTLPQFYVAHCPSLLSGCNGSVAVLAKDQQSKGGHVPS